MTRISGSARIDRRAVIVALFASGGCGPKESSTVVAGADRQASRSARIPRVSVLVFGARDVAIPATTPVARPPWVLVRERLSDLGRVDGRTIVIEEHFADGDSERLAQLARSIADSKPDVIVAFAINATLAVRRATDTIPIVMVHGGDPVGAGLAKTLSRPGGNVTGTTSMVPDLGAKQIEILRQLVPRLATLGVLFNPTNPGHAAQLATVKSTAQAFGIRVTAAEATRAEDFNAALAHLRAARADALFVMNDPMVSMSQPKLLDFARDHRLPVGTDVGREMIRLGGLVSFGPVLTAQYGIVAEYVDKILKGAQPGELPIQQPTHFALRINLTTAKELGVTVPQALLLRADEVFE